MKCCRRCNSAKVLSRCRTAITLAVEVMEIIAKTSRNPPKVSWPIESENARARWKIDVNAAGMDVETGLRTGLIYPDFHA